MKKITYFILSLFIFGMGCKEDEDTDGGSFHPRIFDGALVFQSPSRIIQQGQPAVYNGLSFSPKPLEKTKISWKVNGEEVSTDTSFTFNPSGGGEFEIRLEATYNGQTATRISKVLVSPATYTRKSAPYVVMSYLSENGTAAGVTWNNISHLAFNGARVLPDGTVDFSKGNQNQNVDELVARGHINGVPVLLGITGRLSGIDGWSLYNSTDFGTVISDPVKRAALVRLIDDYVTNRKLDGVDVMMTDLSNDDYSISAKSAQSVGPFLTALKSALPAGSIVTMTATTNYMHWEYTDLSAADWINVHAFENGATVGPGAPVGQPSPFSYMVDAVGIWRNKGIPANKIVAGIPAFGLRYNQLDANGNNASWGSYDYMTFAAIVAADAQAPQKEYAAGIAKGVYYNGIPLVNQKANYIKNNGFKGVYVWAGDYDATGENSLIGAISKVLK
ncbi:glycosyl hydrolase family 18 protein [Arcticibacter tournemirensis]